MSRYRYNSYRYHSSRDAHSDRIVRAFEQPLTLLQCTYHRVSERWDLRISSSTGQGYYDLTLTAGKTRPISSSCTCPDFDRRQKPCKHMLCVLLRILKLKQHEFTSVSEVGKCYGQITEAFLNLFHREEPAKTETTESTAKAVQEEGAGEEEEDVEEVIPVVTEPMEEEMCLICLLEFTPPADKDAEGSDLAKCSSHCQRWLGHKDCLNTWFMKSGCCPLCKGPQRRKTTTTSSSEPAYKRIRYAYNEDDEDVDIDALQAQEDDANIVDAKAFFQILED